MLEVVPYRAEWQEQFRVIRATLLDAFGAHALAISHIGSTAIVDLHAKPIIDVQVSVADLDVLAHIKALPPGYAEVAENQRDFPPLGYDDDEQQWSKRYIRLMRDGRRLAHIHVRVAGSANERIALLFRDYLQCHTLHREAYGRLKRQLAEAVGHLATAGGSGPYVELKDPFIAVVLLAAEEWSVVSGWSVEHARN